MEDFLSRMKEIVNIASCPVCLERLSPDVVCCINGHAICSKCKQIMTQCPTCRNPFSTEGHIFITQLLEAMPSICSNEGCSKIIFGKSQVEEHEKLFCSFRMIECKCCPWVGKLKYFEDHFQDSKCEGLLQKGMVNCSTEAELLLLILDTPVKPFPADKSTNEEYLRPLPCEYYEQKFWRIQALNLTKDKLTLQFICLPDEKAMGSDFVIKITFQSNETKLFAKTKLTKNYEHGGLEGSLVFDTDMLKKLKTEDSSLGYKLSIQKFNE